MIIDRKNIITKEELETNLKEANIKIREAYLNGHSMVRSIFDNIKVMLALDVMCACAVGGVTLLFGMTDWLLGIYISHNNNI